MTTIANRIGGNTYITEAGNSLRQCLEGAAGYVAQVISTLLDWQDQARQRYQLLGLTDGALKDFGASRADAAVEGDKPFWQS